MTNFHYGDGLYGADYYGGALNLTAVLVHGIPQSPGYQVTVTGLESIIGFDSFTVTRLSASTTATGPVRGMDQIDIVTDSVTQTDYEFSFLETFLYQVTLYDVNGNALFTTDSGATINGRDAANILKTDMGQYWPQVLIRSTQQPGLNQAVQISDFATWSIPGRVLGTFTPLGRPNPVLFTDKMGGRTGSFNVLVADPTGNDPTANWFNTPASIEQLLTYGDTLMFQCLYFDPQYRDMFFKVTDISVTRQSMAGYSEADNIVDYVMVYQVSFTEVDRPSTSSETLAALIWQDLIDNYPTWQAVLDSNATWLDVLNQP